MDKTVYTVFTDLFMMLTLVLALVLAISSQDTEILTPIVQTQTKQTQVIPKGRSNILLLEVLYQNSRTTYKLVDQEAKSFADIQKLLEHLKHNRPEGIRVRVDKRASSEWVVVFAEAKTLGVRTWLQHK